MQHVLVRKIFELYVENIIELKSNQRVVFQYITIANDFGSHLKNMNRCLKRYRSGVVSAA